MDFPFVEYYSLNGGENFLEFTLWIASCLIIDCCFLPSSRLSHFKTHHKTSEMQKRACKAMRHILVTKFLDISPNSQSRTTQTNRKSNEKIKVDRRQETHLVYGFLTGALIRSSKASFASRVGTVTSWCTSSPSIPSMSKLNSRRTFSCLCAGAVAGLQTRKFTNLPIFNESF